MNKKKLSHSNLNSSITSVLAALLCIVIGMAVGFLVLLAINPAHAWGDGFVRIVKGGFHDAPYGVGKELANAAPLIMTGLSVAFAFKTGLFNIGAAGQYTLGAYGALYCAIMLKMPWYVCLIVATILDPAAQRISYTVQLTEEPEDWITQKQWYGVASYADVEIFYPTEGSYYRQTDVPHLRFYEWGLADQPTNLESQRPDMGTRYNDYIVDSVTVLSADGSQSSTFRRVGQSLLLDDAPDDSGRNAISWSIRID